MHDGKTPRQILCASYLAKLNSQRLISCWTTPKTLTNPTELPGVALFYSACVYDSFHQRFFRVLRVVQELEVKVQGGRAATPSAQQHLFPVTVHHATELPCQTQQAIPHTCTPQSKNYVTLPPEMSRIATPSLFWYSHFPKWGYHMYRFSLFNEITFSSLFSIRKIHLLHTQEVYKCH